MADAVTQIVAIDGPAGAGKSSVSREVARRLGMAFLDTGAMYRAATWWAMSEGVAMNDREALVVCTESMPFEMYHEKDGVRVLVDDEDVTEEIRTREVTVSIKKLDGIPGVRDHLVRLQREFGMEQPTVAEGRDMGTVVFPDARCKIFLEASISERVRRRAEQLTEQGEAVDLDLLQQDIVERDENDRTRAVAPLKAAEDAFLLDTSAMSFDEVVDEIVARAKASL